LKTILWFVKGCGRSSVRNPTCSSDGDGEIQRAMRAGAAAYLLKSMPNDQILSVIRSVHAGRKHVPVEVAAKLAEHLGEESLTAREVEVLRLIRDGHRNKQIADELGIAETTVNFHIKNLVGKLGANDRTQTNSTLVHDGARAHSVRRQAAKRRWRRRAVRSADRSPKSVALNIVAPVTALVVRYILITALPMDGI
jgi:DNA-binding CsgD family transcriptional regulator